jgi:hypothetical protein
MLLLSYPGCLAWSDVSTHPHIRALASAYAASPDCKPSNLLRAVAPRLPLRAPSAAAAGTLCEVRPLTVEQERGGNSGIYVTLTDEAGTRFLVQIDQGSSFWSANRWIGSDLQPPMKVNAQLVEGNVTMIADGAKLLRTTDHPEVMLHTIPAHLFVSGLFSIPPFALLAFSVRAWVKRSRRLSPEAIGPAEKRVPAWGDPLGAAAPTFACPNFQGRPLTQARQELEAAGYKMGRVSFIASPSSPVGTIVAQTPPPGSQVAPGAAFSFQVSMEG